MSSKSDAKFIVRSDKLSFEGTPKMVPTFLNRLKRNSETEYLFELFELIKEYPDDFSELEIDVPNKTLFYTLLQIKNSVLFGTLLRLKNKFLKEDEKKIVTKLKKKEDTKEKPLEGFVMWYDVISKLKVPKKIKEFYDLCKTNKIVFELHENKPIPKSLYESFVSEVGLRGEIVSLLETIISKSKKKRFPYEELDLPSM